MSAVQSVTTLYKQSPKSGVFQHAILRLACFSLSAQTGTTARRRGWHGVRLGAGVQTGAEVAASLCVKRSSGVLLDARTVIRQTTVAPARAAQG